VNISYADHWELDLFGGPSTSPDCQDLCCKLHPTQLSSNVSDGTDQTLKCIFGYINGVKKHIDLILSNDPSTFDSSGRRFAPQRDQAAISTARSSCTSKTSSKDRVIPDQANQSSSSTSISSSSEIGSSPLARRQRKHSQLEAEVYSTCAAYYIIFFPRLYAMDRTETPNGPYFDY